MNNLVVYKVVSFHRHLGLYSACLAPSDSRSVYYSKGKVSKPQTGWGSLFAFKSLETAKAFRDREQTDSTRSLQIYSARAKEAEPGNIPWTTFALPLGTIFCDEIELQERMV